MEPKFKKEDKLLDMNLYLYNEIFRDVTTQIIHNVFDYYQISNYGRLYHKKLGRFIKYGINGGGYYYVMLSTYDGPKPIQIHRLVMMTFCPIENHQFYQVNHNNGNKLYNHISNLEWATPSYNQIHSYNTGLHPKEDTSSLSIINSNIAYKICELLSQNIYTNNQIADIVGNNVSEHIVSDIKSGRSWKSISTGYTFNKRPRYLFTEEMVNNLCLYFERSPIIIKCTNDYCRSALSFCGYPNDDKYVDTARKIYKRKYYTNISNKYNF